MELFIYYILYYNYYNIIYKINIMCQFLIAVLLNRDISDVCLLGDSYVSKMSGPLKNDQKEHGRLTGPWGPVNIQTSMITGRVR